MRKTKAGIDFYIFPESSSEIIFLMSSFYKGFHTQVLPLDLSPLRLTDVSLSKVLKMSKTEQVSGKILDMKIESCPPSPH